MLSSKTNVELMVWLPYSDQYDLRNFYKMVVMVGENFFMKENEVIAAVRTYKGIDSKTSTKQGSIISFE